MVCIVKHYICEFCSDSFDTLFQAKEHEKECKKEELKRELKKLDELN